MVKNSETDSLKRVSMKKWLIAAVFVIAFGVAVLGVMRMQSNSAAVPETEVSARAADVLGGKIETLKSGQSGDGPAGGRSVDVSEAELESYVLFRMRDSIPVDLDSFDVSLTPHTIAAETQVTIPPGKGGFMDAAIAGTHNLQIRGRLSASGGTGKFDLEDVRVDGFPVPRILIETLMDRYVTPKYPDADLRKPFAMPWGIESLEIGQGKATIQY